MMFSFWEWFWIIYGVVAIVTFLPITKWCWIHMFDSDEDSDAKVFTILIGMCCAPFWIFLIPGMWAWSYLNMESK